MYILQVIVVLTIMALALSVFIDSMRLINDEITRYVYRKNEEKRREQMRIRNHKHSKYVYISQPNGMTEIVKRESI